ncbi:hypothetical protein NJC10_00290 [Micrococcus sp. M4NT]|uniref:hypothetical protein n=1 Tax=Micrococcus sp. M4NT TaxID=2957501 RepID=UPI0029B9D7F2|nr:hypothetical protein [Micrococcus sp. M4NT]MDX2340120.1 hypothetical protein [Micrococcus sp. M4NT]
MTDTVRVICNRHYGPRGKPRTWTVAQFIHAPDGPVPWVERPATHGQVAGLVRRRAEDGTLPVVRDPAQAEAAAFLANTPPTFAGGSKPTTFVHLLNDRPPEEGEVTADNLAEVDLRHLLDCDRCVNAGKSAPLYVRRERLWELLDTVAATGVGEVPLDLLVKMNGTAG